MLALLARDAVLTDVEHEAHRDSRGAKSPQCGFVDKPGVARAYEEVRVEGEHERCNESSQLPCVEPLVPGGMLVGVGPGDDRHDRDDENDNRAEVNREPQSVHWKAFRSGKGSLR